MDMKSAPLSSLCALPLYFTSRSMASFDFTTLLPIPSFLEHALTYSYPLSLSSLKDEVMELGLVSEAINQEYWANDGVVPLFSQWHPFRCRYV
ncbi:hypothetical protein FPV67DRAFT_81769 [Lyophyllum atratum]|nr:hypothetical protein FPV67DRAFT_81769 [Lyophyllum atratum]